MKYLLLICAAEGRLPAPEEAERMRATTEAWVTEMDGRGIREQGHRLRPVRDARTVRVRKGRISVTDGPFVETKEQIAGFDLIECASLEEAIEVASKHPVASIGAVEVRPFFE